MKTILLILLTAYLFACLYACTHHPGPETKETQGNEVSAADHTGITGPGNAPEGGIQDVGETGIVPSETLTGETWLFTEMWVWTYENKHIPRGEEGHKGEMQVYYDPKTGSWLFEYGAYGLSGEMMDWIIGRPDGTYILQSTDEHGKKTRWKEKIAFQSPERLDEYWAPTGKQKVFNRNDLGFPTLNGREYRLSYEKTTEKSMLYLTDRPGTNFAPLYHFNLLNIEARLPIHFPRDLPVSFLLLEDSNYWSVGQSPASTPTLSCTFHSISHTEYSVGL